MNEFIRNSKTATLLGLLTTLLLLGMIGFNNKTLDLKVSPGNDRFGLAFISSPDSLATEARYAGALATGARWDRWPLYWHWVAEGGYVGRHQAGRHDYDTLVAEDIRHGLTPLVILLGTPAQQAQPLQTAPTSRVEESEAPLKDNPIAISTATLPPSSLAKPIFADGTDELAPGKTINPANAWAKFVFQSVERYRPGGRLARQQGWPAGVGVRYWEIWNEPDHSLFWGGSVADYYRLLEVAYKSIKAADPQATVLLGGLAFYEKPGWLPELLRLTGGDPTRAYFEALSLHHYWSIYQSEARLVETKATLATFGLTDVPLWLTESGVSVWDDYPATAYKVSPDTPWRGTRTEQAAYVIQHSALAFYHGVERYYHFMLHDDCGDGPSSAYGLRQNFAGGVCNPAQGQPRPAYAAYRLAARQFEGIIPLWRQRTPEQDQVAFYRPQDKARVVTLWATQGVTVTTSLTATGSTAQLYWIDPTPGDHSPNFQYRSTLTPVTGVYTLTLPPATNRNTAHPGDTNYHIGGRPYILVERDMHPPASTLTLPPTSPPRVVVTWQGQDEGSGIASYDVWLSVDDQSPVLWLANTAASEATFAGQIGHTYGLTVRARDRAGNEEAASPHPQATTRIVTAPTVSGLVLAPNGSPVSSATVTIAGPHFQEIIRTDEDGVWPPMSLPPGDYTFQATAPDYAAWPAPRYVRIETPTSLTLTLAPTPNAIAHGDFEGEQVWTAWTWAGRVNVTNEAFAGQAAIRLGESIGETIICPDRGQPGQRWTIRQTVSVPDVAEPVLSFMSNLTSTVTTRPEAWFEVTLLHEGESYYLIPPGEMWQPSPWQLTALPLSKWRGQPVDLQFQAVRCSAQSFKVTLDQVGVGPVISFD